MGRRRREIENVVEASQWRCFSGRSSNPEGKGRTEVWRSRVGSMKRCSIRGHRQIMLLRASSGSTEIAITLRTERKKEGSFV
jgi:hypothetical protein